MKILMMTNTYAPIVGGIEQSIRSFSDEFRSLGHDVLIAAPSFEGQEEEKNVVRVPALHNFNKTDFSINLPVSGAISKLMKTFLPDIIHSHHPFFMGDFAFRLSRQYRIPLVFTHHIMFEQYMHYLPVHNEKMKRFILEIATGYANLTHQVIAPSLSVRDILLNRGVTVPIEIVPTGIDLEHFAKGNREGFRDKNQIPRGASVVGYVGRLASEKNLEFLIHGLIELLKQESGTHVLMVGHGPLEAAMVSAFRQAGLGERFHLAGFLHNQELIDAYSAMDIFAFTSLSETQGIVLAEAMAVGIPVVAVEAPAVGEMVQDGFNGRLIKGGLDEQRFVEALSWGLHCDPAQRRSLEEHARETARHYSIHVCGKHMLKVYEHVREKELMHFESKDNAWQALTERIKAEWDMLKNIVEAGEAAMFEKMPLGWRERENA